MDTLFGQPADFSPQLADPMSAEFMAAVEALQPFVSNCYCRVVGVSRVIFIILGERVDIQSPNL